MGLISREIPRSRTIEVKGEQRRYDAPLKVKRDIRGLGRGLVLFIVAVCVLSSIAWSTVNIYELFKSFTGVWWVPIAAAALVDLVWVGLVIHEYNVRTNNVERKKAQNWGWVILALSVAMVIYHGSQVGTVPEAVFGGLLACAVKVFWSIVMSSYAPKLDEDTQNRINILQNDARVEIATLETEREVNRIRALVAAEREAMGIGQAEYPANTRPEYTVNRVNARPEYPNTQPDIQSVDSPAPPQVEGLSTMNTQAFTTVPVNGQRVFTREEGVNTLIDLIKAGKPPTIREATELLGVTQSSAQRWLADAKSKAELGGYV